MSRLSEERLFLQTLLGFHAAREAVVDAGVPKNSKTAVLIGMSSELELHRHRVAGEEMVSSGRSNFAIAKNSSNCTSTIGNIIATRVSAAFGFVGPSFTITEKDCNSCLRCLEYAEILLNSGEVDYVVVGAVDCAASAERLFLHSQLGFANRIMGDGAGAVVVSSNTKNKIYATLEALSRGPTSEAVQTCFDTVTIKPSNVRLVESTSAGNKFEEEELSQLCRSYSKNSTTFSVSNKTAKTTRYASLGRAAQRLGDHGEAGPMAALIKSML